MASSSTQPGAASNKSILTPITSLKGHEPFTFYFLNGEQQSWHEVSSICYFPDGKQLISGSGDKTARRWDLRAGKEIEEMREVCEREVWAVAVSRDGRWVVTGGGVFDAGAYGKCLGELKVCDDETGTVRRFEGHSTQITCIDISANSTLMASGSYGGTARIWNLDTGKLVAGPFQSDDTTGVGAVRFSQDSKKLAVKSSIAKWLEVWDVETQKLDVRVGKDTAFDWLVSYAPVFWTTKDKAIVAVLDFNGGNDSPPDQRTVCEFDALTLKTVGAPFEGHTDNIYGLALSFDCALLASACNSTIKLWAFESRQLLASFDVQSCSLFLSPSSLQLVYLTYTEPEIHICNIPPKIIATIWPNTSKPKNTNILNSDATRRDVPRKPVISHVTSFTPRLQRLPATQQRDFFHYLRIVLPSRTNARQNDQHRDPLDFSATSPLPRNYSHLAQEATKTDSRMNPYENARPPITRSSTTFKARLHDLWTGHALSPIVDTPLAQGKERNAAADAPPKNNKDWIPYEDHVPSRLLHRTPIHNHNNQPQCRSTPEIMGAAGYAAASKLISQVSSSILLCIDVARTIAPTSTA